MPCSRPSLSLSSWQLRSCQTHPVAIGSFRREALSTPNSEEGLSLAAEPTEHGSGVDAGLSSEGLDDSSMELWPVLNTQHDVGVDADMSLEGQGDIVMDGSPSPCSQDSYGMDLAPLPEGLDFDMGLPLPPGAPKHDVVDVPQPFEKTSAAEEDIIVGLPEPLDVAGESLAACIFIDCNITMNSAGTGWVWGKEALPSPGFTMEEGEASTSTRVHKEVCGNAPNTVRCITY